MDGEEPASRLSRIETRWSVVRAACGPELAGDSIARQEMVDRYAGAVHRYLLGALRDEQAADDCFQEFWLKFLRGAFRNADPGKGRFRSLLKSALYRQALNYRQRGNGGRPLPLDDALADSVPAPEEEAAWKAGLRGELIDRAWVALERTDTRQPLYPALRRKADFPQSTADELAAWLTAALGRQVTPEAARQTLKRARDRFSELLVLEVRRILPGVAEEDLDREIMDLGLEAFCKGARASG